MRFELLIPEEVIIREIQDKKFNQKDIAKTMAIILRQGSDVDWKRINAAIVNRWSKAGLNRIKEMAWSGKCFDDNREV